VLIPNSNACVQKVNTPDYYNVVDQIQGTAPKCPVYYVQDFQVDHGEVCVWNNKNIFSSLLATSTMVFYCNSTSTCSVTPGENGYCMPNTESLALPGQNCTYGFECYSGSCVNNMCQGSGQGVNCTSSKDCNAGLYCLETATNKTCQLAAGLSESCATIPCQSTLLCDLNVCVNYYSQANGAATGIVEGYYYAPACISGFAIKSGSQYLCELAPTSSTPGASCTPGTLCMDSSGKYSKPCVCGFDGNGYCPAFEGDSNLQNAIKSLNKINSVKCNQDLRISAGCFERSLLNLLEYYYFDSNMSMYQHLPYFKGSVNSVIRQTYYPEYFNALEQIEYILKELYPNDDSSSSSSFGQIVGIVGTLALVYLV